jgi:hypothetical protein
MPVSEIVITALLFSSLSTIMDNIRLSTGTSCIDSTAFLIILINTWISLAFEMNNTGL